MISLEFRRAITRVLWVLYTLLDLLLKSSNWSNLTGKKYIVFGHVYILVVQSSNARNKIQRDHVMSIYIDIMYTKQIYKKKRVSIEYNHVTVDSHECSQLNRIFFMFLFRFVWFTSTHESWHVSAKTQVKMFNLIYAEYIECLRWKIGLSYIIFI